MTAASRTVLVIDNDESIVELLAFVFEHRGYTVWTAMDGHVGVELALRHRPAVILCDMMMKQMHGFEVLEQLRRRPELEGTVIIVASAKTSPADIARARELGAADYVVKPFETEQLCALVERHLAGTHQRRE